MKCACLFQRVLIFSTFSLIVFQLSVCTDREGGRQDIVDRGREGDGKLVDMCGHPLRMIKNILMPINLLISILFSDNEVYC